MSIPTGSIIWSMTTSPPEGFLLCNGQSISSDEHPALYTLLVNAGKPYGSFGSYPKVPDLLTGNRFIRAAGGSVGVGTTQSYAIVDHSHQISPSAQPGGSGISNQPGGGAGTHLVQYFPGFSSLSNPGGAGEARPVNIGLLPCIASGSATGTGTGAVVRSQRVYTLIDLKGNRSVINSVNSRPKFGDIHDCGTTPSGDAFCYVDIATENCDGTLFITSRIAYGPPGSSPFFVLDKNSIFNANCP